MKILSFLRQLNPYAVASVSRAGMQAFSLLAMVLAVASVDLTTFGAFSVAWVTTVIANCLVYSGFYEFLIRTSRIEDDQDTLFWLLLAEGGLLCLLMLGIGVAVGESTEGMLRRMFFALAPIPLLAGAIAWWDARLVRGARVVAVGLVLFGAEACSFVVLLTALYQYHAQLALVAWRWSATLVTLAGLAGLSHAWPRLRFSAESARRAMTAAWPLQGTTLTRALSNYAADFLLAGYLSPAAAGAYRAASRIAVTSTDVFYQALRPINWSVFGRHERASDAAGMAGAYLSHLRFLTFVAWPILVCLALFGERILLAFGKPDLAVAGSVLSLLAIAQLFGTFTFFLDPVLVCTGRGQLQFHVRFGFTLVLLAGLLVVARFGPVVVAAWQIVASALLEITAAWLICSSLKLRMADVAMPLLHGVFMAALCAALAMSTFYSLDLPEKLRLVSAALTALLGLLAGLHIFIRHRILTLPRP